LKLHTELAWGITSVSRGRLTSKGQYVIDPPYSSQSSVGSHLNPPTGVGCNWIPSHW